MNKIDSLLLHLSNRDDNYAVALIETGELKGEGEDIYGVALKLGYEEHVSRWVLNFHTLHKILSHNRTHSSRTIGTRCEYAGFVKCLELYDKEISLIRYIHLSEQECPFDGREIFKLLGGEESR